MNYNNLFKYVANRHQERLVQGLLLYCLDHDKEFKKGFIQYLELDESLDWNGIKEEVTDEDNRYDIVLTPTEGMKIVIELKLWADLTENQMENISNIHKIIIPECRREKFEALLNDNSLDKISTWEELERQSENWGWAGNLFKGLSKYYYFTNKDSISNFEAMSEMKDWIDKKIAEDEWFVSNFLFSCQRTVKERFQNKNKAIDIEVNSSMSKQSYYIGKNFHINNHCIWFGFVYPKDIDDVKLVIHTSDINIRNRLEMNDDMPGWPNSWGNIKNGIIIEDDNDHFIVSTASDKLFEVLVNLMKIKTVATK